MLFKLFKRGIESKNENDSNKQKDRDSEKNLNQTKQAQRIEKWTPGDDICTSVIFQVFSSAIEENSQWE